MLAHVLEQRSSRYLSDGPSGVQETQSESNSLPPSSQESREGSTLGLVASKLAEMSIEDQPGFVPELPNVSGNSRHEKADMLISYATVKGVVLLKFSS